MLVQTYNSAALFDFSSFFRMILNILLITFSVVLVAVNVSVILSIVLLVMKASAIIIGFTVLAKSVKWIGDFI